MLGDGAFVGELAFASGKPFAAGIRAQVHSRVAEWEISALRGLFVRNPLIAIGFQNAALAQVQRDFGGAERAEPIPAGPRKGESRG